MFQPSESRVWDVKSFYIHRMVRQLGSRRGNWRAGSLSCEAAYSRWTTQTSALDNGLSPRLTAKAAASNNEMAPIFLIFVTAPAIVIMFLYEIQQWGFWGSTCRESRMGHMFLFLTFSRMVLWLVNESTFLIIILKTMHSNCNFTQQWCERRKSAPSLINRSKIPF